MWSGNRPGPLAPLAQAAAIRNLQIGDVVRLRPGTRYRLVRGERVLLQLADRTISLPEATGPAVERLCGGEDVKVGELPGLDDADQLVVVRRLLTEAVLVPVS
jgi:bifunctional lysine-specific demethylase and histidyl-hydroxylase NO66